MLVSRRRFEGALHGNTTNKNCMAESAHCAIHHADTYGGKTELLITVKLADRKAGTISKTPYSGTSAHTKRKSSGLSSNKIACNRHAQTFEPCFQGLIYGLLPGPLVLRRLA